MPKITVLPHETLCPGGAEIEADPGKSVLDTLLEHGIEVEHACEKSCACTTCHVIVRQGFDALNPAEEKEEDMLDKAWGLAPTSRLACQTRVTNANLVVEIPKYTINMVSEAQHK
jgi:2Fe-2S ferredoxin